MKHPELVDYIKQLRAGGLKKKDIVVDLKQGGWSRKDIRRGFYDAQTKPTRALRLLAICSPFFLIWGVFYLTITSGFTELAPEGWITRDCINVPTILTIIQRRLPPPYDGCRRQQVKVNKEDATFLKMNYGPHKDVRGSVSGYVQHGLARKAPNDPWYIDGILAYIYSPWCFIDNGEIPERPSIIKSIEDGSWVFTFDGFDNKADVERKMDQDYYYRASANPQYCKINGTIRFSSREEFDVSGLAVEFFPIPVIDESVEQLIQRCVPQRSAYYQTADQPVWCVAFFEPCTTQRAVEVAVSDCVTEVARAKKDVAICQRITGSFDRKFCIARVTP